MFEFNVNIEVYCKMSNSVTRQLGRHLQNEGCSICRQNLERFKKQSCFHPDLKDEDILATYDFNECPRWKAIRLPLIILEASLTDEEIAAIVAAGSVKNPADAEFFDRFLRESRAAALKLVRA